MGINLFGFQLGKKDVVVVEDPKQRSFALPTEALDDGAVNITQNAYYGTYVDLEGAVRNEMELITRYREMSNHPELESAISDITNEAISREEDGTIVEINLDNLEVTDNIKKFITGEYKNILSMLNFSNLADDLFKRWYIDGRLYFHVIVNETNPRDGIQELRYIDPRKIRKIREIAKERDHKSGLMVIKSIAEYYVYNERALPEQAFGTTVASPGIKIAPDSIVSVTSGLMDARNAFVVSYLNSAIKPLNQLRMIEDAVVIYRLCLIGDTRIKTDTGWKYIKDIESGDTVYSYWGSEKGLIETKVVKQWKTGTKQTYKVSSKHFSVTGTDNHPILVLDRKTNIVEYVDIKNIIPKQHCFVYEKPKEVFENIPFPKIRDESVKLLNSEIWSNLEIPKKEQYIKEVARNLNIKTSSVRNFLYGIQYLKQSDAMNIIDEVGLENYELDSKYEFLPKTTSVNLPEYIDEEFARLYGFMLGDGTISKNGITFAEGIYHEQNLYYAGLLTKYFGGCSLHKNKNRKYNNYTTSNTLASELFVKLGFTNGAKIKRFPDWIYKCSDEIKKQFILGFCDADGCNKDSIYTGTWSSEIELCNKQLIEDIKEMWTSLGLTSGKMHYRKRPKDTRFFGNELVERTINERESWYVRISDYKLPQFEPIFEVVPAEIEDVYELEVESEKHNFIANGICVHNSRAPERRIFYVDVGNLPKGKAEQYLRDVMVKYRNKLVYNQADGSIVDSRKHLSMLEDFFIPRRDGCFVGSTKIKTLDGRDESLDTLIEEYNNGKENWVYSVSPEGKIVPGKITWAGYTRKNAEILDVYLDNGEVITATPDHKFILRNGTKVEAKDLQPGTSLMPLYTREHFITYNRGSKYLQIKDNIDNKWKFAHRVVGEFIHGPRGKNQILHHIDFARYNQTPGNLVYMDKLEHFIYHSKHASAAWEVNKDDHCNKLSISGKAFFETEQGMKRRQEISDNNKVDSRIINGAANGRKKVVELRAIDKANMSHGDYLAKWSPGLTKMSAEMGSQAAKKQVALDKITLTKEQWDAKYKSRGNTPRVKNYYNLIQNVSLEKISNVFKIELSQNINCNNKILVEKLREHYPTITLETLRDSLKYNGYNTIAEFIYRKIGSEYISNRRLSSINRNIANHKVVKIVYREDRQTVGTLTVDGNNEYHDYHNFALTAGVFVMNSKSTEITTLPGGGALSNLDDIDYFKKKLLQALHVPYSRLEPDGGGLAALGRTTEITRDELKFAKFIDKLRNRFSQLFDSILRIQLSLKGICTQDEWDTFREHIYYDYKKDNNFAELRESELLRERLGTLAQIDPYIGKYYSITWIKKNVLRQSDEEIEEINNEMKVDGSFEILQQAIAQEQPNIQKESFELI